MSQLDEMEYARLAAQVFEIEKLVSSGRPGELGFLLKNFLQNAKSRMEEISHVEIKDMESDKERKMTNIAQAVQLAEMEHELSVTEKRQYAEFLQQDYFTKANFEGLEEFYAQSWDKLSERGKNEMSQRVWEGIKQQEYTFDELPEIVRKKESERLYLQLTGAIEPTEVLENIPPQARVDFVREYEAGNEKRATQILSTCGIVETSADVRKEAVPAQTALAKEAKSVVQNAGNGPLQEAEPEAVLDGMTLDSAGSVPATGLAINNGKAVEKS